MRFELKPNPRDASKEAMLKDLVRVANQLNKSTVTTQEYDKLGKYSSHTLRRRIDKSWFNVLDAAHLSPARSKLNIPKGEIEKDLQRVASLVKKQTLTQRDYKHFGGKFGSNTICKVYGSWFKAIESIGLTRSRTFGVTDEEYFKNLEEIWLKLGRQPFYREIEKPISKYSCGAYERRFGSWRKALEAFVAHINSVEGEKSVDPMIMERAQPQVRPDGKLQIVHKTNRHVSDGLRLRVFWRDRMTCQICGRSRAKHRDLEIVVDHILPWEKGGETVFENLQTLCVECNSGKSNRVQPG